MPENADGEHTRVLPPEARVTYRGRLTAPHRLIRTFEHQCPDCGWQGPGTALATGQAHEASGIVDYHCPSCGEWIAFSWDDS